MLFLVVSTPRPERPSEMSSRRQDYWKWLAPLQADGTCRHVYARAGRGAIVVFHVDGNATLHRLLNEWADIIPAHFDSYPLIDVAQAQSFLAQSGAATG